VEGGLNRFITLAEQRVERAAVVLSPLCSQREEKKLMSPGWEATPAR
jgi:hypothetical protein